jgi:hypothetical protein
LIAGEVLAQASATRKIPHHKFTIGNRSRRPNRGTPTIDGNVSGNGSALIDGTATIELGGTSAQNVTFANNVAGSYGTLVLDHATSYSGSIYNLPASAAHNRTASI